MTRNIYVTALIENEKVFFTSTQFGNEQVNDFHLFICDLKSAAPYLKILNELRSFVADLNHIKAIAFIINEHRFSTYKAFYVFRQKCYEFCQKHGIFYFAPLKSFINDFMALSLTQTMVNEGEEVTVIGRINQSATGSTFIREKNYYRLVNIHISLNFSPTLQWKQTFMENSKPKKIVFFPSVDQLSNYMYYLNDFKKVFINPKPVAVTVKLTTQLFQKHIMDMVQHVMGEKLSQYYILKTFGNISAVHIQNNYFITVTRYEALPLEKSAVIDVDRTKTIVYTAKVRPEYPLSYFEEVKLSKFKCKKVKVTLKLDENGFYDLKVEPYDAGKNNLNKKLSKLSVNDNLEKARIIFDEQNFCVYLQKDGKEKLINGSDKTPIYLSFTEKKPLIGKPAKEAYEANPEFVIFDLIKLCSTSNANIMDSKWGFKFEKEDKGFKVKVQTTKGPGESSIDFLLALILQHGLQMIKNEVGKKMDKIEIGFDGFTPNEILKENFEKAGKILKTAITFG
uniref:Uncharacterized protein n=1 Tax=Panagrolaimus sp. ES5 TaxID=591445 RepID=A0AC34GYI9_9BILA